jgi:magnesium transporter
MPFKQLRKTGLPPGSLIYTGLPKTAEVEKDFMRYTATAVEQIEIEDPPENKPGYQYWLDVRGVHDVAQVEKTGIAFGLDPLLMEDVLDPDQRPKFEQTENGIFVILKHLSSRGDQKDFFSEQISMFLSDNRLVVFQEYPDETFLPIKNRLFKSDSRIRTRKTDYLLYAIIDFITDNYFHAVDLASDRIQQLKGRINDDPSHELKQALYTARQDITEIQRMILPAREVINSLLRTDNPLITEKTKRYLRDVMDNILVQIDMLDDRDDHLSSLHDLFMSEMTYRMTKTVMILTVVAAIFIPLTFITSVYGMNFDHMPELHWPWAYYALWGLMILIGFGQYYFFRMKNWL